MRSYSIYWLQRDAESNLHLGTLLSLISDRSEVPGQEQEAPEHLPEGCGTAAPPERGCHTAQSASISVTDCLPRRTLNAGKRVAQQPGCETGSRKTWLLTLVGRE